MDPQDIAPEVIQNLGHVDLNIRKRGFRQLKSEWILGYREYLWKAIETEKNRGFQADMVEFALETLKERSLRKMIRFVEKDQLFPQSRKHLVSAYLEYETDIVREALLKSLKRPESRTYRFISFLLRDEFLLEVFNPKQVVELLRDILSYEIPDRARKVMITAVINRYLSDTTFHTVVRPDLWQIISELPTVHSFVLQAFFHPTSKVSADEIKPRKKVTLLWSDWNWILPGSNQNFNEYPDLVSEYDQFLLDAGLSRDTEVRRTFIQIMGRFSTIPPVNQQFNQAYLDNLDTIWNLISQNNWEEKMIQLDEVTEQSLAHTFPNPLYYEGQEIRFHRLLQVINVNPHDLIARIWAMLPRTRLLSLAAHDPVAENRKEAILALSQEGFFLTHTTEMQLRMPSQFWYDVIHRILTATQYDQSVPMINAVTKLFYLVSEWVLHDQPEIIKEKVVSKISSLRPYHEELEGLPFAFPIRYRLHHLIVGEFLEIDQSVTLTSYQRELLFREFMADIANDTVLDNMLVVYQDQPYEMQSLVLKLIEQSIDRRQVSDNLHDLVRKLQHSTDVRIRTKAHLLGKKMGRS